MPQVASLDHLVLTVADLPATCAFYCDALGMVASEFGHVDGTARLALSFGAQKINLHQAGAEFEPKAHAPRPGSADLCFLTTTALADWQAHFAQLGITVEQGPIQRTGAVGPLMSIYVRDPDGNLIEIAVQTSQTPREHG